MRLHTRNMVSVDSVPTAPTACTLCAKYPPRSLVARFQVSHATLCDAANPAFAVCDDCLLRWDAEQSGISAADAEAGVAAYRRVVIIHSCLYVPTDAGRTLDALSARLSAHREAG